MLHCRLPLTKLYCPHVPLYCLVLRHRTAPQIQFYMKGGSGTGLVNADMYKDATTGNWQYTYLLVDVYSGQSNNPSRVYIKRPE